MATGKRRRVPEQEAADEGKQAGAGAEGELPAHVLAFCRRLQQRIGGILEQMFGSSMGLESTTLPCIVGLNVDRVFHCLPPFSATFLERELLKDMLERLSDIKPVWTLQELTALSGITKKHLDAVLDAVHISHPKLHASPSGPQTVVTLSPDCAGPRAKSIQQAVHLLRASRIFDHCVRWLRTPLQPTRRIALVLPPLEGAEVIVDCAQTSAWFARIQEVHAILVSAYEAIRRHAGSKPKNNSARSADLVRRLQWVREHGPTAPKRPRTTSATTDTQTKPSATEAVQVAKRLLQTFLPQSATPSPATPSSDEQGSWTRYGHVFVRLHAVLRATVKDTAYRLGNMEGASAQSTTATAFARAVCRGITQAVRLALPANECLQRKEWRANIDYLEAEAVVAILQEACGVLAEVLQLTSLYLQARVLILNRKQQSDLRRTVMWWMIRTELEAPPLSFAFQHSTDMAKMVTLLCSGWVALWRCEAQWDRWWASTEEADCALRDPYRMSLLYRAALRLCSHAVMVSTVNQEKPRKQSHQLTVAWLRQFLSGGVQDATPRTMLDRALRTPDLVQRCMGMLRRMRGHRQVRLYTCTPTSPQASDAHAVLPLLWNAPRGQRLWLWVETHAPPPSMGSKERCLERLLQAPGIHQVAEAAWSTSRLLILALAHAGSKRFTQLTKPKLDARQRRECMPLCAPNPKAQLGLQPSCGTIRVDIEERRRPEPPTDGTAIPQETGYIPQGSNSDSVLRHINRHLPSICQDAQQRIDRMDKDAPQRQVAFCLDLFPNATPQSLPEIRLCKLPARSQGWRHTHPNCPLHGMYGFAGFPSVVAEREQLLRDGGGEAESHLEEHVTSTRPPTPWQEPWAHAEYAGGAATPTEEEEGGLGAGDEGDSRDRRCCCTTHDRPSVEHYRLSNVLVFVPSHNAACTVAFPEVPHRPGDERLAGLFCQPGVQLNSKGRHLVAGPHAAGLCLASHHPAGPVGDMPLTRCEAAPETPATAPAPTGYRRRFEAMTTTSHANRRPNSINVNFLVLSDTRPPAVCTAPFTKSTGIYADHRAGAPAAAANKKPVRMLIREFLPPALAIECARATCQLVNSAYRHQAAAGSESESGSETGSESGSGSEAIYMLPRTQPCLNGQVLVVRMGFSLPHTLPLSLLPPAFAKVPMDKGSSTAGYHTDVLFQWRGKTRCIHLNMNKDGASINMLGIMPVGMSAVVSLYLQRLFGWVMLTSERANRLTHAPLLPILPVRQPKRRLATLAVSPTDPAAPHAAPASFLDMVSSMTKTTTPSSASALAPCRATAAEALRHVVERMAGRLRANRVTESDLRLPLPPLAQGRASYHIADVFVSADRWADDCVAAQPPSTRTKIAALRLTSIQLPDALDETLCRDIALRDAEWAGKTDDQLIQFLLSQA